MLLFSEAATGGVYKEGVPYKFAIFAIKRLCWGLFLMKSQARRPATLLKRDSNTGVFV